MILYPDNILDSLDFELIRSNIAKRCSSEEARAAALSISPSSEIRLIQPELNAVDEALAWLHSNSSLPSTQFEPILDLAQKLRTRGALLDESQFSDIRSSLRTYQNIHEFLTKHRGRFPETFQQLSAVPPAPEVIQMISKILDERAVVMSSASKELASIRDRLNKSRASAARIFERALKKYRDKGLLADFDETVSENRRVLAIQSAYKSRINGIFHSSSNKGSVVFIEPAETVEVNNIVAQLIDEERIEVRRILRQLGDDIRPYLSGMAAVHRKLVWLDLLYAKAGFAKQEEYCVPQLNISDQSVSLEEAYNPALKLVNRQKGKATLPLKLNLDAEQRILVISGPNAGGKTIAMKTLGLLVIMLQSGIPVPVKPQSQMPIFQKVMVDIGDSQSIQNELSTYSSKLVKMNYFLANADPFSLLLIDEFGSGSDPDLGSTLAQVFLERLNSYGVLGIFTTHYNAIKALASELTGVSNAAMLFNRVNLSPAYLLEVGNPGSSYTYEVAGQSGIPQHLIEEARGKTSEKTLNLDHLLVTLQEDKLTLESQKKNLGQELLKLRDLESSRQSAIKTLESKLEKQTRLNEEHDRLLYWGQKFQKLVEGWLTNKSKKDKKEVVGRFVGMLNQRASEVKKETSMEQQKRKVKDDKLLVKKLSEPVAVGDSVKILDTGMKGSISEIKKDRYLITVGTNIRTQVSRAQFVKIHALTSAPSKRQAKPKAKKGDKKP